LRLAADPALDAGAGGAARARPVRRHLPEHPARVLDPVAARHLCDDPVLPEPDRGPGDAGSAPRVAGRRSGGGPLRLPVPHGRGEGYAGSGGRAPAVHPDGCAVSPRCLVDPALRRRGRTFPMNEPAIFFEDVNERQGGFLRRTFLMGGATFVGLTALAV